MALLSEVVPVIGPERDDRVARVRAGVKRVEDLPDEGVGMPNARDVRPHDVAEVAVLLDQFEIVATVRCHPQAWLGNVIQVVRLDRRQGRVVLGDCIVDRLRCVEGQVRLEQPHGQKERLLVVARQELRSPLNRRTVAHLHGGKIQRSPVEAGNVVRPTVPNQEAVRLEIGYKVEVFVP